MSEAGIEVPEFRWPTTPATLASTSFCATVVPTFGSAWSSSATSTNVAGLPSIWIFAAMLLPGGLIFYGIGTVSREPGYYFSWGIRDASGAVITDPAEVARLKALVIPPAWQCPEAEPCSAFLVHGPWRGRPAASVRIRV